MLPPRSQSDQQSGLAFPSCHTFFVSSTHSPHQEELLKDRGRILFTVCPYLLAQRHASVNGPVQWPVTECCASPRGIQEKCGTHIFAFQELTVQVGRQRCPVLYLLSVTCGPGLGRRALLRCDAMWRPPNPKEGLHAPRQAPLLAFLLLPSVEGSGLLCPSSRGHCFDGSPTSLGVQGPPPGVHCQPEAGSAA